MPERVEANIRPCLRVRRAERIGVLVENEEEVHDVARNTQMICNAIYCRRTPYKYR